MTGPLVCISPSEAESRMDQRPVLGAVDKAMVVLNAIIADDKPMGLAELTRRTGLAKATVHRLLAILRTHKMIDQHHDRYVPSEQMTDAGGFAHGDYLGLLGRLATPYLVDLHRTTGETVSIGVLNCCEVRYIDRVYGHMSVRTPSHRTNRAPAHLTAIGRVLLADTWPEHDLRTGHHGASLSDTTTDLRTKLALVRRSGIAYNREEYVGGVVCVASLVLPGARSRPPAAICLSGRTRNLDLVGVSEQLRRVARALAVDVRRLTARHVREAS